MVVHIIEAEENPVFGHLSNMWLFHEDPGTIWNPGIVTMYLQYVYKHVYYIKIKQYDMYIYSIIHVD